MKSKIIDEQIHVGAPKITDSTKSLSMNQDLDTKSPSSSLSPMESTSLGSDRDASGSFTSVSAVSELSKSEASVNSHGGVSAGIQIVFYSQKFVS